MGPEAVASTAATEVRASGMASTSEVQREAHRHAMADEVADLATRLQEILGQRVIAVGIGIADARAVGRYARGEHRPQPGAERRLREMDRITAELLAGGDSASVVRAWWCGMNPYLGERAPLEVLADGDAAEVLAAARDFQDR